MCGAAADPPWPPSETSEPLLGCLTSDVEGGADDGPGVAGGAGSGNGLAQPTVVVVDRCAGGDDAPEGRGVARRGGRRVEVVQAVLGGRSADLHAGEGNWVLPERQERVDESVAFSTARGSALAQCNISNG